LEDTNICELDQQIDTFAYLNVLEEEGEADILLKFCATPPSGGRSARSFSTSVSVNLIALIRCFSNIQSA